MLLLSSRNRRKILKPLSTPIDKQGIVKITLVVWEICISWGILPLLGWSSYEREGSGAVCSIQWKSTRRADAWYVIFTFAWFAFVPLILIAASYAAISQELRKMAIKAQKPRGPYSQLTIQRVGAKKKSIQTGWMMFLATFCVWFPYTILSIISAVGNPEEVPPLAFAIAALIAKTSSFIKPIICFFWYSAYRENVKKILGIHRPRQYNIYPPSTATRLYPVTVLFWLSNILWTYYKASIFYYRCLNNLTSAKRVVEDDVGVDDSRREGARR